jgi:hypothetical protein
MGGDTLARERSRAKRGQEKWKPVFRFDHATMKNGRSADLGAIPEPTV